MRMMLHGAAAVMVVLVASAWLLGCSSGATPPVATPPGTAAPAPSEFEASGPAAEGDPAGAQVCSLLSRAIKEATVMQPGVVDAIAQAGGTADAPIADATRRLAAAYASAVTAGGTAGEPDAVAAVSASAADLSSVCADSGLGAVG